MKLPVVLAVLIGVAVLACSTVHLLQQNLPPVSMPQLRLNLLSISMQLLKLGLPMNGQLMLR